MTDDWTDTRVATLREMWGAGQAASAIVIAFGGVLSRSAVLGKVARLKLQRKASGAERASAPLMRAVSASRAESKFNPPHDRAAALKSRPSVERPLPMPKPEPGPVEEPAVGEGIQNHELTNSTCRWPFGHPGSERFFFCGAVGADLLSRRPYCEFHARKSVGHPVKQKRFEQSALYAAGVRRA